ncbi:hypothetical protein V1478_003973 [Vespula squamosa]|uniref:Uncharacterized protein n=1 Tax=Vespula squamosa TaxID=30214 RepID=A0ABD2BNX7_VESSQ
MSEDKPLILKNGHFSSYEKSSRFHANFHVCSALFCSGLIWSGLVLSHTTYRANLSTYLTILFTRPQSDMLAFGCFDSNENIAVILGILRLVSCPILDISNYTDQSYKKLEKTYSKIRRIRSRPIVHFIKLETLKIIYSFNLWEEVEAPTVKNFNQTTNDVSDVHSNLPDVHLDNKTRGKGSDVTGWSNKPIENVRTREINECRENKIDCGWEVGANEMEEDRIGWKKG